MADKKTEKKAESKVAKATKPVVAQKPTTILKDFVIVDIKGNQEMVTDGSIIEVNRLEGEAGDKLKFNDVYLTLKGGKTTVGKPNVDGSEVEMEIMEQFRGEKIHVRKFKSKSRYRLHTGHRQEMTRLKVVKIKY